MVRKCCVPSCGQKHVKGLTMFKIPFGDEKRTKQWISVIGLVNIEPEKKYFVCQRHFSNSDYNQNGIDVNVKKLKPTAVPSLFLMEKNVKKLNKYKMVVVDIPTGTKQLAYNYEIDSNIESQNFQNHKIKSPSPIFSQVVKDDGESCIYCNEKEKYIKARQYYEQKIAEIIEKEKNIPICKCDNSINNIVTYSLNTHITDVTPKSGVRRSLFLDHCYDKRPTKFRKTRQNTSQKRHKKKN